MDILVMLREFLSREAEIVLFGQRYDIWPIELGIILGITTFIITSFLLFATPRGPMARIGKGSAFWGIVPVPIVEEIIFRLVAITVLTTVLGSPFLAIGASAILFAVAHIPYGGLRLIDTLLMGIILGFIFVEFGIIIPIIAHITHNFLGWFTC